jgi:hypothetical protein
MPAKELDAIVAGILDRQKPRDSFDLSTDTNPGTALADSTALDSLEWARDVYWAAKNLDGKVTKSSAGSTLRYELVRYAKKNMKEFLGQILPKAMVIVDRANAKGGDADIVAVEEGKSIGELQRILRAAVREATGASDAD